ncbi:ADP-ribosylation family protein [Actinoplanes sp. N902-109]|uniref:ADP-ribosylation family protein n=1 Tax=Actinoplanes sp. (strain N902-109) TaxID=649831 RepID=UPI00032948EC|nr:ADP-ribosylation family protein [Actinoplanes sp. N902-109]AGL19286.1 hypothetical protein L083_5776 [Actinoplanes sp. N902-109]
MLADHDARRSAALATMRDRFPLVQERVRRVYGLRLPRQLAVFAAFWASTAGPERSALEDALMVSPWGITDYFLGDAVARDGLDERLHARFRRDPAEFVTVMAGGSDGLHVGLWYDDPAALPSLIVHNYARDSAETWPCGAPTLLGVLRGMIDPADKRMLPLTAALDWFAPADEKALEADEKALKADEEAAEADREAGDGSAPRAYSAVSVFPMVPPGSGDAQLAESEDRLAAFTGDPRRAARWLADAANDLAAGRPALALAVGQEVHWLDRDDFREQGRELLLGAYRMLGRDALAEIARVHAEHRDLADVQVLLR